MVRGQHTDPAIAAAEAAKSAERRFLSLPSRSFIDELTSTFADAEAEWEAADAAFADATPTTPEGALLKLHAVAEGLEEMGGEMLELRHIRSLISYLELLVFQPKM